MPSWGIPMLMQDSIAPFRTIEGADDFAETRLEAIGYVFHGTLPKPDSKRAGRAGSNLLHFARCGKLDKVAESEAKVWFRTIRLAKIHLDEQVGTGKWKWCKVCEREITQKVLNEQ